MSNLTYRKNGDYFLPEMGLTETERQPLGKYGRMRLHYLKENRPGLYTRLILNGKLMEHLQETETAAQSRLETIMNQLDETEQRDRRTESAGSDGMGGRDEQHPKPGGGNHLCGTDFHLNDSPSNFTGAEQISEPKTTDECRGFSPLDSRVSKNKFLTPCDAGTWKRSCIGCIIFLCGYAARPENDIGRSHPDFSSNRQSRFCGFQMKGLWPLHTSPK